MKNKSYLYYLSIAILIIISSCAEAPKGDKAVVSDEQNASDQTGQAFKIDLAGSNIRFTGHGVGKNHPGNFKLSSGSISTADNKITGGKFIIDINSMDIEQKEEMFQQKLKPHLLSSDFFDAEKNPNATFEITEVKAYEAGANEASVVEGANHTVSGNLMLKGTTNNISFPARIEITDNSLSAKANFDINRVSWLISYGNDKSLGDKFISEIVNIEIELKGSK